MSDRLKPPKLPKNITYMTTKSGMKFGVYFSDDPPDYSRLAKFFLLLSERENKKRRTEG